MPAYRSRQDRRLDDAVADDDHGIVDPAEGVVQDKLTRPPVFIDAFPRLRPRQHSCQRARCKDNEAEALPIQNAYPQIAASTESTRQAVPSVRGVRGPAARQHKMLSNSFAAERNNVVGTTHYLQGNHE